EVRHLDLFLEPFLNDRHTTDLFGVDPRVACQAAQELVVDAEDDLHVTWQDVLHQRHRPTLQSFGGERVGGVGKRVARDVPGVVPVETVIINENAHHLGDGQGRVCIVHLDGDFAWELIEV